MLRTLSSALVQLRDNAHGLQAMQNLQLVLLAAEMASRERGPSNGIMGDDLPHDPTKAAALSTARQKTDTAFQALTQAIKESEMAATDLPLLLSKAQQQLNQGRESIDAMARLPRAERTPENIREAILQMFAVIDDLAPAALQLTNTAQAIYPGQTHLLFAARTAAELREMAGRLGSHFTVALTKREKIAMTEFTAIEQLIGRIEQLRSALLERMQAAPLNDVVQQASTNMLYRYFGTAIPYVRQQLAIGLADANFPTDAAGFAKRYVPDMDSIIVLRNALLDEALLNAKATQQAAQTAAYLVIFMTLSSVLLLIAIILTLEFRIGRPLRQAIQRILDVAHGRLDFQTPEPKYQDEIAEIHKAIAVLKDNSLARSQAELQLETQSKELHLTNQALQETAAALESRVVERTTELNQALRNAQSANEAKSRFLALMSHEIRTPMNGILGLAELMAATPLNEQQMLYVKNILSAGHALSTLINDILDFSKIEAGVMRLEPIDCDPQKLFEETLEFMQVQAQTKHLPLVLDITSPLPPLIRCDPARVRQVLINLVGNAIKFTEQGRVQVKLHANQRHLICEVIDTGLGMSANTMAGLFEPFHQASHASASRYGGTGLGLVICKALIQQMHGNMSVSSTEGQGSCFTFELPLHSPTSATVAHAPEPNDHSNQAQIHEDMSVEIAALRVLLVDDHPINRLMARNQLNHIGCWVEEAHNGLQALEKLLEQPFDVVLMDIQMPEMDGLQATRELRRLALDLQPVVVAMTANAYNEDRTACLAAGMEYFLAKPVTLNALRVALNKIAIHKKG